MGVPITAVPASRMRLDAVVKGRQTRPLRIVLYGVEGIGKSTFGASAPAPIFLAAEDGTAHLDVHRLPVPETWDEVLSGVRLLATQEHPYRTLVVDTVDWVEPLLWKAICERDGKKDIEDYGYGKGYVAALDQWRVLLGDLERLRERTGMAVILLAHSWIKPFKNPEGDDYDRYELKIHNKAGGLLKEWADVVLFSNWETLQAKDDRTKRVRGVSTGARMLYTTRTAAYDAKNRFDLPEVLPLDWSEFCTACAAHAPADPDALAKEITRKANEVGGDVRDQALRLLGQNVGNAAVLAKLNDRLNAKLAEKREREGDAA